MGGCGPPKRLVPPPPGIAGSGGTVVPPLGCPQQLPKFSWRLGKYAVMQNRQKNVFFTCTTVCGQLTRRITF